MPWYCILAVTKAAFATLYTAFVLVATALSIDWWSVWILMILLYYTTSWGGILSLCVEYTSFLCNSRIFMNYAHAHSCSDLNGMSLDVTFWYKRVSQKLCTLKQFVRASVSNVRIEDCFGMNSNFKCRTGCACWFVLYLWSSECFRLVSTTNPIGQYITLCYGQGPWPLERLISYLNLLPT